MSKEDQENVYKVVGLQITFFFLCSYWLNIRGREIITLFVAINLDIYHFSQGWYERHIKDFPPQMIFFQCVKGHYMQGQISWTLIARWEHRKLV